MKKIKQLHYERHKKMCMLTPKDIITKYQKPIYLIEKNPLPDEERHDQIISFSKEKTPSIIKGIYSLTENGCIVCGGPNIKVKYFGERHLCKKCQESLKDKEGSKVVVFLDKRGTINACIPHTKTVDINVDIDDLRIHGYKCYATYADTKELVICLKP